MYKIIEPCLIIIVFITLIAYVNTAVINVPFVVAICIRAILIAAVTLWAASVLSD
jgi:hypothetical protein